MNIGRQALSILAGALLATCGSLAAQSAEEQQAQSSGPSLAGTVVSLEEGGFSLKTADGESHKVAVNRNTEQLVKVSSGAQVIVEYRRKVGGFVIAQRIRPAGETAADAAPAEGTAAEAPLSLTAEVVSWNDSALVVKTNEGEVTFFLAPTTEYLVKSLDPGLQVIVEYSQDASGARMATRVRAAEEKGANGTL